MRPAHVIELTTPKGYLLNGIWFGPKKHRRAIVWVHGLTSSMFSKMDIMELVADKDTAVLAFNNRGHDNVARLGTSKKKTALTAGSAFERFEDCVDDIQGAVDFARKQGAKDIYIAGHSTGCQKAVYWIYKRQGKGVKGLILLAPLSDYVVALNKYGAAKLRAMVATARAMLKSGRSGEFVRSSYWKDEPNSPSRFISLYTPDSLEQAIFPYFEPTRPAKELSSIRVPILAIFAEDDEYADRPVHEIASWFETHTRAPLQYLTAKKTGHGFKGAQGVVSKAIKAWMNGTR